MADRPTPDVRPVETIKTQESPAGCCPICNAPMMNQRAMLQCRQCGFAQCASCTGEMASEWE